VRRLVLLLGLVLAAGCGDGDDQGAAARAPSFVDVPWVLASGLETPGWERAAPSATFDDGRVGGSNGCNRYGAPYTLDGENLEIGQLVTTQMACGPPGDAVEREYTAALGRVAAWRVDGSELVLLDGDGEELLRFPAGDWTATSFLQGDAITSTIIGTEVTASFADDGTLSGSAGCNPYRTTYTTDRGAIAIEPPSTGRKACAEPEGVMELEQAYLSALPLALEYRLDGEMLTLLTAEGTIVANYVRAR
jgi:heat shock protein HslJ